MYFPWFWARPQPPLLLTAVHSCTPVRWGWNLPRKPKPSPKSTLRAILNQGLFPSRSSKTTALSRQILFCFLKLEIILSSSMSGEGQVQDLHSVSCLKLSQHEASDKLEKKRPQCHPRRTRLCPAPLQHPRESSHLLARHGRCRLLSHHLYPPATQKAFG